MFGLSSTAVLDNSETVSTVFKIVPQSVVEKMLSCENEMSIQMSTRRKGVISGLGEEFELIITPSGGSLQTSMYFRDSDSSLIKDAGAGGTASLHKKKETKRKSNKRSEREVDDESVLMVPPPENEESSERDEQKSAKVAKVEDKKAVVYESAPSDVVVSIRSCVIQYLAVGPKSEEQVMEKVGDLASESVIHAVLSSVAKKSNNGKYELLNEVSLWASVNLDDPEYSKRERKIIKDKLLQKGLYKKGKKEVSVSPSVLAKYGSWTVEQLWKRYEEIRVEVEKMREEFVKISNLLKGMKDGSATGAVQETASHALNSYETKRPKLDQLRGEARDIRLVLKKRAQEEEEAKKNK